MKKLGKNKDDQKRTNAGLVLKLIATGQCNSRIDLAKTTGLTKTAISQIVGEMIDRGLVEESEKEIRMETGRNPMKLIISPKGPKFIGIQIGRVSCAAVLCDLNAHVLKEEWINQEWTNEEELFKAIFKLTDDMLAAGYPVTSIGVAAIGPVNVREGIITNPFYFHGIQNVPVRKVLEAKYHLPVYFDHDNQSAALAEHLFGNGKGTDDILMVSIASGVGCGIMVRGHRIHSAYGWAPEIGHITIDYRGKPCVCGNKGCLEQYVNSIHMMQKFKYITGKNLSYEQYMELTDIPEMDSAMKECATNLAIGIVNVINILNSQVVLLGMNCVYWPDKYIKLIEKQINEQKFGNKDNWIPVRKAAFGINSQVIGAACNAMNRIFNGEAPREVE